MCNSEYLFVYGTLKRRSEKQKNHYLLRGAQYLGKVTLKGPYALMDLGPFPGIVDSDTEHTIHGELYSISPKIEKVVDKYEGYPNLYEKEKVVVENTRGDSIEDVMFYKYNENPSYLPFVVIEDGEW